MTEKTPLQSFIEKTSMVENKYIYVIAGNNAEFVELIKSKPIETRSQYRYVFDINTIRDLCSITGVFYGTWRNRPDLAEIQNQIFIIKKFKGRSYEMENQQS